MERFFYIARLLLPQQADQIKRVSPVSWKHVNFYGQYNFLETAGGLDLSAIVDSPEAFNGGGKTAKC